jgi:outer membrane protein assembly factor BamB
LLLVTAGSGWAERSGTALEVAVGTAEGPAPLAGLNVQRSRQSQHRLPKAPELAWRIRVVGPVVRAPIIDNKQALVVSHGNGLLTQLNRNGKVSWRHRLGDAAPASDIVVLSDGTRAVVNADNALLLFTRSGNLRQRVPTNLKGEIRALLPTPSGGVLVAGSHRIVEFESDGTLSASFSTPSKVQQLLAQRLAVTQDGTVYRLDRTLGAEPVAKALGGARGDVVLNDNRLLFFDAQRDLISLNLLTRRTTPLAQDPGAGWLDWLAVGKNGIFLGTREGLLVALDNDGRERSRVGLLTRAGEAPPGLVESLSTPPPFVDPDGELAIALPGQGVAVFGPDGSRRRMAEASCLRPVAVLPAGDGRLALACHSGEIWLLEGS